MRSQLMIFCYTNVCYFGGMGGWLYARLIKARHTCKKQQLYVISFALLSSMPETNSLARSLVTYTLSFNGYHGNEKKGITKYTSC